MELSEAGKTILCRLQEVQGEILSATAGHEQAALIELVRALDHIAFAFMLAPDREHLLANDHARHLMLRGAGPALEPLLKKVAGAEGGIPWRPTTTYRSDWADKTLHKCGILVTALRLAELERYGLARSQLVDSDNIVIEVVDDALEQVDRELVSLQRSADQGSISAEGERLASRSLFFRDRIDQYIGIDGGWYIRYDSDEQLRDYYRDLAAYKAYGISEGYELPDQALLGSLHFEQWRNACISASGRVMKHIACATRLRALNDSLELRNLLTCAVRKDDAIRVLQEDGLTDRQAADVLSVLSAGTQTATAWHVDYEIPVPYYIDAGRDFFLLPAFGALLNPFSGMARSLKSQFAGDWDKSVGQREDIFRSDLQALFPSPRYSVPSHGHALRRPDGSTATDIDASVTDLQTGRIALFQLKWHDIYGRSLRERSSRQKNLGEATKWISCVHNWMRGRDSTQLAKELGLKSAGKEMPLVIVLARHAAHFTGDSSRDSRAIWMGWRELVQIVSSGTEDPFLAIGQRTNDQAKQSRSERQERRESYSAQRMTIEIIY